MEEHTTTTTTTTTHVTTVSFNLNFLTSVPGILKICELVFGLLCWALTASVYGTAYSPPHQFIMFVAVTSWVLTLILFILYMAGCHATNLSALPWGIIEFFFNAFWALLYFIASCVSAARTGGHPNLAAATAFAFFTTIFYIIHAVISYRHWQGGCSCVVTSSSTSSRGGNTVNA